MRVHLLYPSGNLTALVETKPRSQQFKQDIENKIYKNFPNVEQVGFIYFENNKNVLEMVGNEMCINACLCYYRLLCSKNKKNKSIFIKWPDYTIEGFENPDGTVAIASPEFYSTDIQYDTQRGIYIVKMLWITHLFTYDENFDFTESVICHAKEWTAVGVSLIGECENVTHLKTQIFLPHIGNFREETSCGSWTVAYWALMTEKNGSISEKIIHPSGLGHHIIWVKKPDGGISLQLSSTVEFLEVHDWQ